jgi:hypothetical protein
MIMNIAMQNEKVRNRLLANPKRILNIARNMGANVRRPEKIFRLLLNDDLQPDEWYIQLEEMISLTALAIIEAVRVEFRKQGLGEFDVEKYFLKAMLELKKCSPDSIKRAQDSIKRARLEAKRLQKAKKQTVRTTLEIEAILKETKKLTNTKTTNSEYKKIEESLKETLNLLDSGNYELSLHLSKSLLKNARDLKDIKLIALRNAAKAGHVVGKVKGEDPANLPKGTLTKLNTFLSTIKYLLEEKDYQTSIPLAKDVKREAVKFYPPDKLGISKFVCPICFDLNCPNAHCHFSISPSPIVEETCRTYCSCGTLYHICCVQKGENLTCISCYRPLKG